MQRASAISSGKAHGARSAALLVNTRSE